VLVFEQSPRHAVLVAAVVLAAAGACLRGLERPGLGLFAAGLVAVLAPVHQAPLVALAAALLPAVLTVWAPGSRWLAALLAGTIAAGAGAVITRGVAPAGIAGVLAAGATVLRPSQPTQRHIAYLRAVSLYGPAIALAGLMAANAATGYADALAVRRIVLVVVALSGASALVAIAGLGLSTLLESDDPLQRRAWTGLAAGLAVPMGLAERLDPSLALEATAVAAVPLVLAVCVATARWARSGPGPRWAAYAGPIAATLAILGI